MAMCPLCNGFSEQTIQCTQCSATMVDAGRTTDYLDEYSAYEDIEVSKLVDGMAFSLASGICIHLFTCEECGTMQTIEVKE
jgi:hypothetical protein